MIIRQFGHDFDIDLLVLILYHSTEVIRDDMVLLGTPGNLIEDYQTRSNHGIRTAHIVNVGKCVAIRASLEGQECKGEDGTHVHTKHVDIHWRQENVLQETGNQMVGVKGHHTRGKINAVGDNH